MGVPDYQPLETIHLYIVREEEAQVVDSSVQESAKGASQPLAAKSRPSPGYLLPYCMIATHLVIVLFALSAQLYLAMTDTATITIIPKTYRLTEHLTLSTIQSRVFQPVSLTESKTVPATGTGHQDATVATGTITLYNAATFAQTIDAGTLFIGSDGVHIVTDETATIPGATPPLEGQTVVNAHAVNPGAAGNIRTGDIQGACCRENIFVSNSAFQGGADQRDYIIVTKQDINSVVSVLVPHLTESIQATFQKQVHPGETLAPNLCSETVSPDRSVGEEATQVTVTIRQSCIAGAYSSSDLHAKIQKALAAQAANGYMLASYVLTSPLQTRIQSGRLVLSAMYQATMRYHFSADDLLSLRHKLAGKTSQQAIALLSHLSGAAYITVQVGKTSTLPTDPTHIHILLVS